jgi:hypothetical protein
MFTMMEKVWVCVYRDTVEEHDEVDNLAYVEVTMDFLNQYVKERKKGFENLEEFLDEYTADTTEDFYEYAMEHGAVIAVENE